MKQQGGPWTKTKLDRVSQYLTAWTTALKNQPFKKAYLDVFAGKGSCELRCGPYDPDCFFPELTIPETIDGSARKALKTDPPFDKYVFIEKDPAKCVELNLLKGEFGHLADRILVRNREANAYLTELCQKKIWHEYRAVLFLDPYGMQVEWNTIRMIAETRAIDLWYLFPLGQAVGRLLKNDGRISPANRKRLNRIFGTESWYEHFYRICDDHDLFSGQSASIKKNAAYEVIGRYFVERLETLFPGVAQNPLMLRNSKQNPLYLLCFAASNKKGAPIALKIAENILRRPQSRF
jgi:three-Cys-motif partner protein